MEIIYSFAGEVKGSKVITINITGEEDGYGNGFIDPEMTDISTTRIDLIAG